MARWLVFLRRVVWRDDTRLPRDAADGSAFAAGSRAYGEGQPIRACPHQGRLALMWRHGWREAHADDIRI